jgi:ribosomal protein S18 acetylase RimI-like enzyme
MIIPHAKPESHWLRPTCAADEALLFELFAADKRAELALFGVPPTQAEMLVAMQYRGREMTYRSQYPHAEDSVILDENGAPVGRLLVDRAMDRWRIVDFSVLPVRRGNGLGTAVLRNCLSRCEECGASLELAVSRVNRARALYERLGFRATREDAFMIQMAWGADLQAGN